MCKRLGKGAFGTVYRGRKIKDKSYEVAIKVLDGININGKVLSYLEIKPKEVSALLKEITAMYKVQSPGTVKILEIEEVKES